LIFLPPVVVFVVVCNNKKKRRNARAAEDFFSHPHRIASFFQVKFHAPITDFIKNYLWLEKKKKVVFGSRHSAFLTELLIYMKLCGSHHHHADATLLGI
jgi:hypothetical protein